MPKSFTFTLILAATLFSSLQALACSVEGLQEPILEMPAASLEGLDDMESPLNQYLEERRGDEFLYEVALMAGKLARDSKMKTCRYSAFEINYRKSKTVHRIPKRMFIDVSPVKVNFQCVDSAGATKRITRQGTVTVKNTYITWDRHNSCYGSVTETGIYLHFRGLAPDLE